MPSRTIYKVKVRSLRKVTPRCANMTVGAKAVGPKVGPVEVVPREAKTRQARQTMGVEPRCSLVER